MMDNIFRSQLLYTLFQKINSVCIMLLYLFARGVAATPRAFISIDY